MVTLRPTRKLIGLLPPTGNANTSSDTALGDWYVNRIVVDRCPLLLLISSASLLPMLVPARDVRGLPGRLADLVEVRLRRLGIAWCAIESEKRAMADVKIAPTASRSVVGILVDFARMIPSWLDPGWDDHALTYVEDELAETPCYAGRSDDQVVFPKYKAPELLHEKWTRNPTTGSVDLSTS